MDEKIIKLQLQKYSSLWNNLNICIDKNTVFYRSIQTVENPDDDGQFIAGQNLVRKFT